MVSLPVGGGLRELRPLTRQAPRAGAYALFTITTQLRATLLGSLLALSASSAILAAPGTDGTPGVTITDGDGPNDHSTGGQGGDATGTGDGGDGGAGGDIASTISSGEHVSARSYGGGGGHGEFDGSGQGGDGGDAGTVHLTIDGSVSSAIATSEAGSSGLPSQNIQPAALGGAGGNVTVVVTGAIAGALSAASNSGAPSDSGSQAPGIDSGMVTVIVDGTVGGAVAAFSTGGKSQLEGGRGGDVSVTVNGRVDGDVTGESVGGSDLDDRNRTGDGGTVTVTIAGTVGGRVMANTDAGGTVSVVLEGGVVTGGIYGNGGASRTLTFDFEVASKAELDAATAVLTAQQSAGTVTINGRQQSWSGFTSLVNLLRHTAPADIVSISVQSESRGDDAPVATSSAPAAASCGSSPFRSVQLGDGSIAVFRYNRGGDILVGQIAGGVFRRGDPASGVEQARVTRQARSVGRNIRRQLSSVNLWLQQYAFVHSFAPDRQGGVREQ